GFQKHHWRGDLRLPLPCAISITTMTNYAKVPSCFCSGPRPSMGTREGETRAKRARGSLTHHLELRFRTRMIHEQFSPVLSSTKLYCTLDQSSVWCARGMGHRAFAQLPA